MGIISILVIGSGVIFGTSKLFDVLGTADAAKNLKTEFSGVKWKTPTAGCANFDVKVKHTNKTSSNLAIQKLDLNISIAGFAIGSLSQSDLQTIPSQKTVTHTYRLQSEKWTNLSGSLFQMILTGELPEKVTLEGTITANGFSTDINTDIPLSK